MLILTLFHAHFLPCSFSSILTLFHPHFLFHPHSLFHHLSSILTLFNPHSLPSALSLPSSLFNPLSSIITLFNSHFLPCSGTMMSMQGTDGYMGPEVMGTEIHNIRTYGVKADVYSFGVGAVCSHIRYSLLL